jgi:RHS repeat-associated protein
MRLRGARRGARDRPYYYPNWQAIDYKHDVYGRRSEKKVDGYSTRYLYACEMWHGHLGRVFTGWKPVPQDGNNNLLRKYIYGPGIDQTVCIIEEAESETYYYHYDALGSVVALSDSSGDTVQTYQYSVFGQVAAEDEDHPNPYMFAGVRFDMEIGLYYNRARYYNPFMGRFLQTDPIGYDDGMNLYAYCMNNPTNLVDPSGNSSEVALIGGLWANNLPKPDYPGNWTSWQNFFGWYAHGEGQTVDLSGVGLLDDFRLDDKIGAWTKALQKEMDEFAEDFAKLMLSMGKDQATTTILRSLDYDFAVSLESLLLDLVRGKPLVVLGNGTLHAKITIKATRDTDSKGRGMNRATWTLKIDYSMEDEFKDPSDWFDSVPGEEEWIGCHPYKIVASWSYVNGGKVWGSPKS